MFRRLRYSIRSSAIALVVAALAGCGADPEPAMRVGDVGFVAEQVAGLSTDERALLADLAGLGGAVADGRLDSLVAPLARREAERSRLRALPYHLAARDEGLEDERLRRAYTAEPEWELRVRHVVRLVPSGAADAERTEAMRTALEVERRARAGEDFARLAAEYSEEPRAAERGGLLEPGRAGSWVEPFWKSALALRPGETSPVVETEYGYHVLRLESRDTVPFEEARRLRVLRSLIPAPRARAAMEDWVATAPMIALDPPAVLAARDVLQGGAAEPGRAEPVVLARLPSGEPFSSADLAIAWASLPLDERRALEDADDAGFGSWVENEVRETAWAREAARLGAEPEPGAEMEARGRWVGRVGALAAAAGFTSGMTEREIASAALRTLEATGQDARILRAELPALRPLLRRLYPVAASS